ncbi:hypothetical protein ES703_93225 [subsurface metagenome]
MKIIPDPKKFVKGYVYNINGHDTPFKSEDIIHMKLFSSTSDYFGTPPTQPAKDLIALDLYALKFNTMFFKAGARVYGVLETERTLSERATKRLESKWIGQYGGYRKAFKTAVLEEGLKYKTISSTHKDMAFIEQMKIMRESICSAYGVYPAVVGLFEFSNYANSSEQRQFFYEETIIPLLIWMQENVSAFLCPRFGPRIYGEFDQSEIGALKEKEEIKARKSGILKKYDIFTVDEIREMFYGVGPESDKKLDKRSAERILELVGRIQGNLKSKQLLQEVIRNLSDNSDNSDGAGI